MTELPPRTAAAEVLAQALAHRSIKQKALADLLDVTPTYVSSLLSGRKAFSAGTVERMVAAVGLTPDEAVALHRAAAADQGFRLDLPDGF